MFCFESSSSLCSLVTWLEGGGWELAGTDRLEGALAPSLLTCGVTWGVTYPFWPSVFSSVKYKYWMKRSFHQFIHYHRPCLSHVLTGLQWGESFHFLMDFANYSSPAPRPTPFWVITASQALRASNEQRYQVPLVSRAE